MADPGKQILKVLSSLDESALYCTSGALPVVLPGLEVKKIGDIGVPISASQAQQLIEHATQAPYGRGEETIVDTDVRNVWQIDASQLTIKNPQWDSLLSEIIKKVQAAFSIHTQIDWDLYKLLIYEKGSFFTPHRDTEKIEGMFATLIVCLPSAHEGGLLLVSHDGHTTKIDFSREENLFQIQYAAFYADCQHEIKPVKDGYRVCLVYNLALPKQKKQPQAPSSITQAEQLTELLKELFTDSSRDKIAIPLKHEYTQAALSRDMLKGRDRFSFETLLRAAESLGYDLHLALMVYHQEGSGAYGGYWGEVDDDIPMDEIFVEALTLEHWVDPSGKVKNFGTMGLSEDELVSDKSLEDFPIEQTVHEATGNEGSTVERWYRQAVVVIWPPDRYFRILASEGSHTSVPALADLVSRTKNPANNESCRAFAHEIVNQWYPVERGDYDYFFSADIDSQRKQVCQSRTMLELLAQIEDESLIFQFIKEILPNNYDGTEGEALARIGALLKWENLTEPLVQFVEKQKPGTYRGSLEKIVAIFERLCSGSGKMTARHKEACLAMAASLEKLIHEWNNHRPEYYSPRGEPRQDFVAPLVRALSALKDEERLDRFLTMILEDKERYPLHSVLIPAVKALQSGRKNAVEKAAIKRLREQCITELKSLTATPIEEPKNWKREASLSCSCKDCKELKEFLRDAKEQVHRFQRPGHERDHLENQIRYDRCDVNCTTEKHTRPYILVCTKNKASYQRERKRYETDLELLAKLEKMKN